MTININILIALIAEIAAEEILDVFESEAVIRACYKLKMYAMLCRLDLQ